MVGGGGRVGGGGGGVFWCYPAPASSPCRHSPLSQGQQLQARNDEVVAEVSKRWGGGSGGGGGGGVCDVGMTSQRHAVATERPSIGDERACLQLLMPAVPALDTH